MIYDFLIVGGGIFGLSTAVELARRKYKVGLINPASIPHPTAASSDVAKIVRMEYGSDLEYFQMAEICIERWHEWNDLFGKTLYHEVGFVLFCKEPVESDRQSFERHSYHNLQKAGYQPERLSRTSIQHRFPAVNAKIYKEACFNPRAGYVESALAIKKLADYARSPGSSNP